MGEGDPVQHLDAAPLAARRHQAGIVGQASSQGLEGRQIIGSGDMGQVMFHPDGLKMDPRRVLAADLGQLFQGALGAPIAVQMLHDRPGALERMAGDIGQLGCPVGCGITGQGDMGHIP